MSAAAGFPALLERFFTERLIHLNQWLTMPPFLDADADGEHDDTDRCPDTKTGALVDDSGCSLGQFCAAIDANAEDGKKTCNRSDWQNDEPLGRPKDCKAKEEVKGSAIYLCLPR